jgi:antitoxin component of MazEF toxin-antitoxin module
MKLRKVGNSLGTTFSREVLSRAGFTEGDELEVLVTPGEISIRPATATKVFIEFTPAEARALASGKLDSKAGESAITKVRREVGVE